MKLQIKITGLLLLAGLLLFAGCSSRDSVQADKDINAADAAKAIFESVDFQDDLLLAPDEVAKGYYLLDDSVAEFAVYVSGTGGTAEEIAVLKVADKADVDKAKGFAETRLKVLKMGFENYVPAEMVKLENAVIETRGDIVYFVCADDPAQAVAAIDALYK